jgi:hypothetical protein
MPRDSSLLLWATVAAALTVAAGPARVGAPAPDPVPDPAEVRLTIGESAVAEWLKAATPYVVTVGNQMLSADLVLSEPSGLSLSHGRAALKIRVRGRSLPVDQILSPVITVIYDQKVNRYFGVLSRLPIQIPGLGTIDLRDYVPRFEIPAVLENIWSFADRPVGLNLNIRRIAILDHAVEIGASVSFSSLAPAGRAAARGGISGS